MEYKVWACQSQPWEDMWKLRGGSYHSVLMHVVLVEGHVGMTCGLWVGLRPFGFPALCVRVECDVAPSLSLPIWTIVAHVLIVGIHAFLVHEHTSRYCAGRSTLSWSHALYIEWCCRVVYSTVGTLYYCNGISLVLDYIWRIHSSLWKMWQCMCICIVPTCCSCHNSDCQGTCARLCLTVDALFVGQRVHMHSSHGHMCCYITWDA